MSDFIDLHHVRVVGHAMRAVDALHQPRLGQHALEVAGPKLDAAITVQQRAGWRSDSGQGD